MLHVAENISLSLRVLDLVASDNVVLSEHLERIDLAGLDFINEKYFTCFVVSLKGFVGVRARLLVSDSFTLLISCTELKHRSTYQKIPCQSP
jgi:hypothetical protein